MGILKESLLSLSIRMEAPHLVGPLAVLKKVIKQSLLLIFSRCDSWKPCSITNEQVQGETQSSMCRVGRCRSTVRVV